MTGACQKGGIGREVIAVIGSFFFAGPFGLGLSALVVLAWVVEPAVPAGMEVGVATGAGVPLADAVTHRNLNCLPAFPAIELHNSGVGGQASGARLNQKPDT